jgi:hypothetical protein
MGMAENGMYDVAAVEADGRINVDSGSVFELDSVTPGCDGDVMMVLGVPKGTVSPRCKSAYISRMLFHSAPRLPQYCPSAAHRSRFTSLPINHPISNA